MRTKGVFWLIGSAGALAAAVWLVRGKLSDVVASRYPTLAEVRAVRAVERGWLPPLLPESAVGIRESNDLDSNTGDGGFSFAPSELEDYLSRLRRWEGAVVVEQSDHWSASLSSVEPPGISACRKTARLRATGCGRTSVIRGCRNDFG